MASYFPMVKNTAQRIVFPILDADGDPVTGAVGLDSEYSLDGGAFVDCTNEATEIGTSGIYYLDLVAGETNGGAVCIRVQTSTSGAKTTVLVFYTSAQSLDTIDTNIDAILADTGTDGVVIPQAQADKVWATAARALTDKAGFTISGTKTTLDALNDITAAAVKTAIEAAGSHLALIKAKTDNLPSDPADDSDIDAQLVSIDGKVGKKHIGL